MKKRSYAFSIVTGIASLICVAVIVFAIYASFMGYVFYEIYSSNAKASSEITEMVTEHIINTRKKVSNYADSIWKFFYLLANCIITLKNNFCFLTVAFS